MTDIIAQVRAAVHHWHDSDSGDAYCLQIELGNDHAITLTVSQKDQPGRSTYGTATANKALSPPSLDSEFVAAASEI